jgi:acyl transferase domain-containing protein
MIPSNGTESTGTPVETPKQTTTLLGTNKYKLVATAAKDQHMDKIEAAVEEIAISRKNQKEDPRIASLEQEHIALIAQSQHEANEALKKVLAGQGKTKKFVNTTRSKRTKITKS